MMQKLDAQEQEIAALLVEVRNGVDAFTLAALGGFAVVFEQIRPGEYAWWIPAEEEQ